MCCFKRVVAVAGVVAVMASSAFASWDYFPPKDAGSGEAKLEFNLGLPAEKVTEIGLGIGARYSIIQGLEASVWLPVPLSKSHSDIDKYGDGYAGLALPEIGVRYWLEFGLGFFADFILPVDTRDEKKGYPEPDFTLVLGPQFSMSFTDELSFGSQLALKLPFGDADLGDVIDLSLGIEVDYSLGMVTPYIGFDVDFALPEHEEVGMDLTIGANFDINDSFGAGVYFKVGLGDGRGGPDDTPMTIGVSGSFNF